jgi:DNA-binding PadR family transcriptional regulator
MVLAVLERRPMHGYAVIEALSERSDGRLSVPTGTVYPALRRLERAGLVAGEWSEVDGRRRRTYQLTDAGRRSLADERDHWSAFANLVSQVMRA